MKSNSSKTVKYGMEVASFLSIFCPSHAAIPISAKSWMAMPLYFRYLLDEGDLGSAFTIQDIVAFALPRELSSITSSSNETLRGLVC